MKKGILLFWFTLVVQSTLFGQIKEQNGGDVCLSDLAHFSYVPPGGKTVTTYAWDFGDGFTSNNSTPIHLYKFAGTYTVQLKATFSGGSTKTESLGVNVLTLPKASFIISSKSDTCEFTNNIGLIDQSTPAEASRKLVQRIIVWDDGKQTITNNLTSNEEWHKFPTYATYDIDLEVVDQKGCKTSARRKVTIVPGVKVKIDSDLSYPTCDTAVVCFTNASIVHGSGTASYTWLVDNETSTEEHNSNNPFCKRLSSTKKVHATLQIVAPSGCKDEASVSVYAPVEQTKREISVSDRTPCYGDGSVWISVNTIANERCEWRLNNQRKGISTKWEMDFERFKLKPGKIALQCDITKDNCEITLFDTVDIKGPIADAIVVNQYQCGTSERVYFVDASRAVDTANTTFVWYVNDPFGDNCVINRSLNQNKYKNCNTTVGWFAKHDYDQKGVFPFKYLVEDRVTGCRDSVEDWVGYGDCGQCGGQWDPNDTTIRITLCEDQYFLGGKPKPGDPDQVSLDSGKTWYKFPYKIGNVPGGLRDLYLVFKRQAPIKVEDYGDDSVKITRSPWVSYDTSVIAKRLVVVPLKRDSVSYEFIDTACGNMEAVVNLENGVLEHHEKIVIDWGDGKVDEEVAEDGPEIHKRFSHVYETTGYQGMIRVKMYNKRGCENVYTKEYRFGYELANEYSGDQCLGGKVCILTTITDFKTYDRWSHGGNYGQLVTVIDGKDSTEGFDRICRSLEAGWHTYDLIVTDAKGCTRKSTKKFVVQKATADVTQASKLYYCKGLMQFEDSSSLVVETSEYKIEDYTWDFGTGEFSAYAKNPIQSFDGSQRKIHIRHAVRTTLGCTDTIAFDFYILSTHPEFSLKDSLGCAPHTVHYTNLSTGVSHFIWELGDTGNVTVEKTDYLPVDYTYNAPGIYNVFLIGVDSFYSKTNDKTYYCHTYYPDPKDTVYTVTILPSSHPGIVGPEELCAGESGVYFSLGGKGYDKDEWIFEQNAIGRPPGEPVSLQFDKPGVFELSLFPVWNGYPLVPQCMSPPKKTIAVYGIEADFGVDAVSTGPYYKFINKTKPDARSYLWDFGDYASGLDNNSTETNPSHIYKNNDGRYTVCLEAVSNHGCRDTVCKPIDVEYQMELEVYNVFTPGDDDFKNDVFEIAMEGESSYDVSIFNRWGELVFHQESDVEQAASVVWNGRLENLGKECPSGTYFYIIKYADQKAPEEIKTLEGTVTLIR